MWKQLLDDYIHCTQMEFIIKHPVAIIIFFVMVIVFTIVADLLKNRKK